MSLQSLKQGKADRKIETSKTRQRNNFAREDSFHMLDLQKAQTYSSEIQTFSGKGSN